jgi:phosphoglycolate phosphatase-like HAD superfamily hydrolase
MEVLALDFDGVISDSAFESFVVALRTFFRQGVEAPPTSRFSDLGNAPIAMLDAHPLYQDFLELMPLGNRAEDFAVALCLLDRGDRVADQAGFDLFRESLDADFLASFHQAFYGEREALRAADPGGWLGLLRPFEAFVSLLRRRADDRVLALATAKDRVSIDLLLDAYGISHLFPDALIVDKEAGRSKRSHLELLRQSLGVAFEDINFVDDKLNHLEDVSGLGVRCTLAAWGYNGERERRLAARRGFLVCDLDDAEDALFGALSAG